ncbi:MAG: AAA family ATPase [Bacteroidetes bacterium]|nr:AAA family ATPase [Bacteroidota bacterium]
MEFQLHQAKRSKAKIKVGLQGPSGGGKTYSALLLAKGLVGDWSKIAVIDTENHSADLYSHLGNYNVLHLEAPFTPERYISAIEACEKSGMQAIVVDSISHEWEGTGGILSIHSTMVGNSFTNWSKLTPRHNEFIQKILQSPAHIIATIRTKQDYVLSEKNGKQVPEKIGLKGVTREGMDYELTIVFDININHHSRASKDRTGLFDKVPEFVITEKTGQRILQWCNHTITPEEMKQQINACKTLEALTTLYHGYPEYQHSLSDEFTKKKLALNSVTSKASKNGATSSVS